MARPGGKLLGSRAVRACAADNAVPVIDFPAGERKHLIAEEYLRTHSVGPACS